MRTNIFTTFQDDWTAFRSVDMLAPGQLLWANDFPHTDSTWSRSQELLARHTSDLTEAQCQSIMCDNTARVFNLPAGQLSWRMNSKAT